MHHVVVSNKINFSNSLEVKKTNNTYAISSTLLFATFLLAG